MINIHGLYSGWFDIVIGFTTEAIVPLYITRFFADLVQKLVFEQPKNLWAALQTMAADSGLLQHTSVISIIRESSDIRTRCIGQHQAPFMLLGTVTTDLLHCKFCGPQNPGNVDFSEDNGGLIVIHCRTCASNCPPIPKTSATFSKCSDQHSRRNIYTFDFPLNERQKTFFSQKMVQRRQAEEQQQVEGQKRPAKRRKGDQ